MAVPGLWYSATMVIHGSSMAVPWQGHGSAMALSWQCPGSAVELLWQCCGTAMALPVLPWQFHGVAMTLPWHFYASGMVPRCGQGSTEPVLCSARQCHSKAIALTGSAMAGPRHCHGLPPWHCHGPTIALQFKTARGTWDRTHVGL